MIKAVIFDMDGVLVDSERIHYLAYNKLLRKHGKEISKEYFKRKLFGVPAKQNFIKIFSEQGENIDETKSDELAKEKDKYYREISQSELTSFDGATELLKLLRKNGLKTALATSASKENVEMVIKKFGWENYFDAVVTADDVKKGKPDPEIFLKAGKFLGVNSQECIVIEDSKHGIEAAKKAGMKCIAVTTTHKKAELNAADLAIDSVKEIRIEKIRCMDGI